MMRIVHDAAERTNREQHVHSLGYQSVSISLLLNYSDIFGGAVSSVSFWRLLSTALSSHSRSRFGTGKLRSYLDPPGAVGGLYGSGCFHFSSKASVSWKSAYVLRVNMGPELRRSWLEGRGEV